MYKFLFAILLVLIPSYALAQCSNGTCSVGGYQGYPQRGSCGSRACSSGACSVGGYQGYTQRSSSDCSNGTCVIGVQGYESMHLYLKNIPGGYEKSRYYISISLDDENYKTNIPVVNGYIPSVTVQRTYDGRVSSLILDYGDNRKYNNSYGASDGYVHYHTRVNKASTSNGVTAVKLHDERVPSAVKLKDVPAGVSRSGSVRRPSDSEIDSLFNNKKVIFQNSTNPTNEEVDRLLKKPSSVGNDDEGLFPNYNR